MKTFAQPVICLLMLAAYAKAALPEPPKQHDPWQPPSSTVIPDYVIKVAAILFDAGLADPRGGVYRKVEIVNRYNEKKTMQTHAWTFPGDYAVCWNGLVYRVRSVGALADVEQDVRAILVAEPWRGRKPFPFRSGTDSPAAAFWSGLQGNQTIMPASIALLLRLGRTNSAEQFWDAPEVPNLSGSVVGQHEPDEDSWLATSATAWFGTAYIRLVIAFERKNDQEAADVAESILAWQSRLPNKRVPKRILDISFLEPVPALLADSKRRLREHDRPGRFLTAQAAVPLTDLIARLEDVQGSKLSFPGRLEYSFDPVYTFLKNRGDEAVPALLDAYENDRRLTRTFDYSRPWSIVYTPISVHEVVGILLGDILGDVLVGDTLVRNSNPAELRIWWQQRKSRNQSEAKF